MTADMDGRCGADTGRWGELQSGDGEAEGDGEGDADGDPDGEPVALSDMTTTKCGWVVVTLLRCDAAAAWGFSWIRTALNGSDEVSERRRHPSATHSQRRETMQAVTQRSAVRDASGGAATADDSGEQNKKSKRRILMSMKVEVN